MPPKTAAMSIKRTPNGALSDKPIALRLFPAEMAQVKQLAGLQDRSMASVCRQLVITALAQTATQQPKA